MEGSKGETLIMGHRSQNWQSDRSIIQHSMLLLGAGASLKAGVPITSRFNQSIKDHLSTFAESTSRPLIEELEAIPGLLGRDPNDEIGLEPLYEAIDDCLDAFHQGIPSPNGLTASRKLERLQYEIKRTIQIRCDIRDVQRTSYMHGLLRRLRRHAPFPIASLNYDNVIETACDCMGLSYAEPVFEKNARGRDIELIKMHGSVTWFRRRGGNLTRVSGISNAAVRSAGELRSPTLDAPLIYPSRRKMPIAGPFIHNALRFQELLRDKKRTACIAVGYSFPDMHLLSWLHDAMQIRPELLLYIVDPFPGAVIRNLVNKLPTVPWKERLRIVPLKFEEAVGNNGEFEENLRSAKLLDSEVLGEVEGRLWRGNGIRINAPKPSGLGASPDGASIFMSCNDHRGRVYKIELDNTPLESAQTELFCEGLRNPRGIAVAPSGELFVVENRLFPFRRPASKGAGRVVRISANGRHIERLLKAPFMRIFRAWWDIVSRRSERSERWKLIPEILRWPTDIAYRSDGVLYVTEARSVVRITPDTEIERIVDPGLTFNLNGIDIASDEALVLLEQGIAQTFSWGRLSRLKDASDRSVLSVSEEIEGNTRLMGICVLPAFNKVIVSQCLTWPLGGLWLLDYPNLDNPCFIGGFDFPQKLAFVPGKNLVAISDGGGIMLIAAEDLMNMT